MCPEGYGFTTMSLVGSTSRKCIKCPLNTFQPIDGTQGGCIKCPENTYTLKDGSTSLLDCIPLPGYFNLVDNYKVMAENIESSHQTYNEIILQSLKVNCYRSVELISPSNMILRESIESCVELCKLNPYCKYAHYYRFTQFAGSSETPKENFCSLYTTFGNKIPIIKYEPVSIRDDNHVVCEIVRDYVYPKFLLCPRNYYCPGGLNSLLIKCPLNSVTLIEGSSNPDHCLCLPGYYPYNNFCTPCKKGSYKPTISNELCTKCPENTTTAMEGSFFINQCTCTKNKYAAPLIQPKIATTNRILYTNTVIDVHEHGTKDINEESLDIDWLLSENIKDLVNRKLDFYCSTCLYGYFCKGMWLFSKVHMPPVPCYAGSSVPISSTKQSTSSCMCNPGYGIRPLVSNLDTGFGMECEKCLPGTFKSVYENEPCHELCPVYSTSLPGSESEKECFCIPGFYNNFKNGKFQCKKCPYGSICYGGIQNGIHTKPVPKSGFAIVDINNSRNESTNSFLQIFPQNTNPVVKNDHIRLTYPCVTPARCIGGGKCFEGSSGLLCTECDPGYDLHHFNSKCKKCLSNIGELIKIILPRITLYCLIILLSLYNKRANSTSELSLVTIFKILYSYTLSLVPLGIIPSNSPSSIRKFYNFYEKFFYHPLNFYAYVDRVNCFRNLAVYVDFILNRLGFDKTVPKLTELNYIEIWYLQRYFGIFKLILDIIFIFIIDFILYIVNKTFSICQRSLKRRLKFLRIKVGTSNVSLSTSHDETEIKFETHPKLIFQHIIVLICLHLPSISLNSLSMIWCTKFPLRKGYVLLHMPNQECTFKNKYFMFGSIVSGSSMGFIFILLLFLFFKFWNCEYTSGWGNIFITGYRKKYRNWDVVQLIRQILIIFLIVCRNSIDSNKSEINRILFYLIIHIIYLVIMLSTKPYDSRSGFVFLNLEKYLIASNIFSSMFMYGSYFHNFSIISGLPFIVSAISYVLIFSTLLREFITICCIISRPREYFWRNFTSSFISFFKHNHSLLYFNQHDDTMVFEAYNISKKKSIDSIIDSVNIKRDKTFLITCLREVIEVCISHKNIGVFSSTLFYFYIRLIFWNSRCMKIDIFSKNIAKYEIIEYVLYLYFFNKKYKGFAKLFLLNYPFNTIRSHIVCFHNSESCGESCEQLQYKTLDECFDHISSTLLVDILFEEFYNDGPITLSQFYYSLISLNRMNKSEIVRIYEIFTKYLDLVRNFGIKIKKTKLKVIENEINALKERAKQEGDYGALMSEKQKRTTELESLRLEVDELKDSLEEEMKKIDSIGTRFSRASALKIGVEKVLSEHLTNDEIIKSISKLERKLGTTRKSSVFSNKKRVDSIYKLKVT
uniref:Cysteine repeat modular protein homologue, putative n=1 Tax=Theileria annulata TaxID=5874 RepID=A0A3B0MJ73_THEAN